MYGRPKHHLQRPVSDRSFVLQTYASRVGIAAVLYQSEDDDDERRIVSYASAHLKEVKRRYHINEQECLALFRRAAPLKTK